MFGVDPRYIETAPIEHVEYWHRRGVEFTKAQNELRAKLSE